MKRILMLAAKISLGHGVSVVVMELSIRLQRRGYEVTIGCLEHDEHFAGQFPVVRVSASKEDLQTKCAEHAIDLVIAHTSPYFEVLPELDHSQKKWAWEHGDPTPELFSFDSAERQRIIENKQKHVYPLVDQVIAISNFIRTDICWPSAEIIYNGCDHLPHYPPRANANRRLRVGFLTRMGKGESAYKGTELILELTRLLAATSKGIECEIMGRGTESDAQHFRDGGLVVHLNATDEERSEFLSGIDVFVSPSLWEGFNLPLVEAQMSGAIGIALDVGAHPEVTPFVFANVYEIGEFIKHMNRDRRRMHDLREIAQKDCMARFTWDRAVSGMIALFH
jgi:glycosyltransferase involved in cell wall biosynthesis